MLNFKYPPVTLSHPNTMPRLYELVENEVYHIFNRSIAKYTIFKDTFDYEHFLHTAAYYTQNTYETSFSIYLRRHDYKTNLQYHHDNKDRLVEIIAYCFMPNHYHLVLKQIAPNGISKYISLIQNSYSRYFNTAYKRKGPLWESRFKNVLVASDDQLLHLTRYVHLNPSTSYLTSSPADWAFSSYKEYLNPYAASNICLYKDYFEITPQQYKEFTNDHIDYQRELRTIKKLVIE